MAVREELHGVAGQDEHVLVYAKVPSDAVQTCERLVKSGFLPVDVGVLLESTGRAFLPEAHHPIRHVSLEERESVGQVAESCFRWSRFHLDPRIPNGVANLVKRRWVESYVDGSRGDALYVAHRESRPVGFLAAMRTIDENGEIAVIDLIGVDPSLHGQGIGQALVRQFEEDYSNGGCRLGVGTQAANPSSIRFYESQGFRLSRSEYVLHAHCEDGIVIT